MPINCYLGKKLLVLSNDKGLIHPQRQKVEPAVAMLCMLIYMLGLGISPEANYIISHLAKHAQPRPLAGVMLLGKGNAHAHKIQI